MMTFWWIGRAVYGNCLESNRTYGYREFESLIHRHMVKRAKRNAGRTPLRSTTLSAVKI